MRDYGMKTPRQACKFIISNLLFYSIVMGCAGQTHPYAEFTLFKIPFGHAAEPEKSSKSKKVPIKQGTNFFPKKLSDLTLAQIIQNQEATRVINKMHGKKLDDCENFIAYYGSKDSRNILYVSVYENADKAKTNLMNMAIKMSKGTSVFSPLTHSEMGDTVHFEIEGMGLKHYFYRMNNMLIWWQVESDKAKATFNDLQHFDFEVLKNRGTRQ